MYRNILVPLDGSELSECALPHVKICASGCTREVSVTLLRVVPPLRIYEGLEHSLQTGEKERMEKDAQKLAGEYLERIAEPLRGEGLSVRTETLSGEAAEAIVDYAAKTGAGLIIIGSHGQSGLKDLLLGSVADKVLRLSRVPVLIARPNGPVNNS